MAEEEQPRKPATLDKDQPIDRDPPRADTAAVPIVENTIKGITQYGDKRRSYFRKRDYKP